MARIALIGGTGNIGQRILHEALQRGHQVSVVARRGNAELAAQGVTVIEADVAADPQGLGEKLKGFEVLISAARFATVTAPQLLTVARAAGIARVLVVGGAASLEVAPGRRLLDTPEFPEAYKPEATAGAAFLDTLRQVDDLDWTFLSPPALIQAGERTGHFRLGKDSLLTDAQGNSTISYEDYAVALLDELEQPRHLRQRFTVAY